ncbi:3-hydroxybenzoate 6-hydroxylase 1 [Escovopsis weberi]|uniref:3-hydroxybenzoate 6-hydroxylase 1 n=1 Tax=Escovopsis weberi TaxID=150374 RepID=A0A0M8NA01_ESCWE|nr:3-hydroxybenzoate 6-hydroxylase 1 [Escovopsis weberi]
MSDFLDAEVIIAGAGIGGLTLAAILNRLGVSYMVLERTPDLHPVGAGISLAPNALALLDQLGLYSQLKSSSQKLRAINIWRNTTQWNSLDVTSAEERYGYPILSAERHAFHRLLYDAAGGDAREEYVRVILEDGKEYHGKMCVGADGIRSAVRRALARKAGLDGANTIKFTGRVHFSGMTAPLEHLGKEETGVANWVLYDDAILTTWPCKDNRQWYIGVKKADSEVDKNRSVWGSITPEDIKAVYGKGFHPFAEGSEFGSIVDKSERVVGSNVFQETDFPPAHSMTSFFGQGGCQAIEDAAVLGNLVSEHRHSLSSPQELLSLYSKARETRVKELSRFSDTYALLHTARLPYGTGPILRWLIYTLLPGWAWVNWLGWLYQYQPTVAALGMPLKE